ncbi:MAG: hypothetical protein JHC95_16625 [Solirubrobacteraceae bacterium]|nr:hypothetical protein [Solirubrobacteraceae bacterium]
MATVKTPFLFGRAREIDRIADAVKTGRPTLIVGEPGVGKTALARAGVRAANTVQTWEGGGIATLDWVSYLPYRRALGVELPDGDPVVVADFLADHAAGGAFIVDDLHWVDQDTVTATLLLSERVPVVAVTRPMPRGEAIRERLAAAGFDVIDLEALAENDAARLAAVQNASLTGADAHSVARRAGGNPLLIQALAHAGDDTTELALALRARLSELSPTARSALNRVAVLERPARLDVTSGDLHQLVDMGLVTNAADGVEVRHALIADAVLQGLSAAQLRDVHRAVAQHVDDPGEAARHWAAADEPTRARELALQAATTATRPVERARCAALAASCLDGPVGDEELVTAMQRLAALGDFPTVVDLSVSVPAGSPHEPEALRLRARSLFEAHDADGAAEAVAAGMAAAMRVEDAVATARLQITKAYHDLWSLETDAQGPLNAVALLEAAGVADAEMYVQAAAALAFFQDPVFAVELAHRGRQLADVEGHAWAEQESWATEATALNNSNRVEEAGKVAREGEMVLLGKGYHSTVARIRATRAELMAYACEFDAVLTLTEDLLARPGLLGGSWDTAVWSRALALNDTGALDAADAALNELDGRVLTGGAFCATWIRAETLISRGDAAGAMRMSANAVDLGNDLLRPVAAATLARAQWECGVPVTASYVKHPGLGSYDAEIKAWIALDAGATADAIRHLELGVSQGQWRRHALWCRLGLAQVLDRVDPERASIEFDALARELREVGWITLLARVEPLLDALPGSRSLAAAKGSVRGSLTQREHDVLTLVSDGLTSRLIADQLGIGQPTVESHIRSAMRKLGAKTRAEAAAAHG